MVLAQKNWEFNRNTSVVGEEGHCQEGFTYNRNTWSKPLECSTSTWLGDGDLFVDTYGLWTPTLFTNQAEAAQMMKPLQSSTNPFYQLQLSLWPKSKSKTNPPKGNKTLLWFISSTNNLTKKNLPKRFKISKARALASIYNLLPSLQMFCSRLLFTAYYVVL